MSNRTKEDAIKELKEGMKAFEKALAAPVNRDGPYRSIGMSQYLVPNTDK